MKKLFLLLILLPGLAWGGHSGSSTSGKEATVTWSYTSACDSAWIVFGYDGDAGDPDTANMYDSLKLIRCFSGTGKELCGDGLNLDSIGSHVVRMYCFSGGSVIGTVAGKWEQKAAIPDVNVVSADANSYDSADFKPEYWTAIASHSDSGTVTTCPTVGEIADGILGENDTTVIDTSQLGKWLIANIGTGACGAPGSNTVIIWIKNAADSSGVAGFSIDVEDSISGASTPYGASTNSAGVCTLGLDNGSYTLYLSAPRWSIASPVYRTISGNVTLTYYATQMSPSSPPPGDSVCIVYGYVLHEDNTPYANARVRIWMDTKGVTYHGSLVDVGSPAVAYTDTAGYFEFSSTKSNVEGILPNGLLEPENTVWWIEVATKERERIYARYHTVPVAASWELVVTH